MSENKQPQKKTTPKTDEKAEDRETTAAKQAEEGTASAEVEPSAADPPPASGDDPPPQEPPSRESVAALAAQIVSAQITGISHHATISALWTNIHKTLELIAGVLDERSAGDLLATQPELPYRLAVLRTRRFVPPPDVLRPIGHADLQDLTQSALRYAEKLLSPDDTEDQIVFAEQMFGIEEVLSSNAIHTRFKDFGWVGLTGSKTFEDMITEVDSWYDSWIGGDPSGETEDTGSPGMGSSELSILVEATEILQRMAAESADTQSASAKTAVSLARLVRDRTGIPVTEIPRSWIKSRDSALIDWFYFGKHPETRPASGSEDSQAKKKRSATRYYRPWGLFRYLRLYGEDDAAKSLNQKLRLPKKDLKKGQNPEAPYPDQYGMHAAEQIVHGPEL